jgi:hypothetical protein
MKPIADTIEIAAGELRLAEGSVPTDNYAASATSDVTYDHMARHARALRLSRELRIRVVVDATGWLKDRVEIIYHCERRRMIRPYFVRVGQTTPSADLTGEHGVWAHCRRYNAGIEQLYQLAGRLAAMVHAGSISLVPGSAITYACEQLSRLDELIALRQAKYMGHSVVRLDRLGEEIKFFGRCDVHLAPIIEQIERAASMQHGEALIEQQPTPARAARGWLRWLRGSQRERAP